MPISEFDRAMAAGAERSRAAVRGETPSPEGPPSRLAVWRAQGGWVRTRARDLWERRKWPILWLGLFLLFDLIAALAAVTMGTHF